MARPQLNADMVGPPAACLCITACLGSAAAPGAHRPAASSRASPPAPAAHPALPRPAPGLQAALRSYVLADSGAQNQAETTVRLVVTHSNLQAKFMDIRLDLHVRNMRVVGGGGWRDGVYVCV